MFHQRTNKLVPSLYFKYVKDSNVPISLLQLQLQSLMETLNSTEPHYIRCVKPNSLLKPAIFENINIMQQLRCGVSKFHRFLCIKFLLSLELCAYILLFEGCFRGN